MDQSSSCHCCLHAMFHVVRGMVHGCSKLLHCLEILLQENLREIERERSQYCRLCVCGPMKNQNWATIVKPYIRLSKILFPNIRNSLMILIFPELVIWNSGFGFTKQDWYPIFKPDQQEDHKSAFLPPLPPCPQVDGVICCFPPFLVWWTANSLQATIII